MVSFRSLMLAGSVTVDVLAQETSAKSFKLPLQRREPPVLDLDKRATGETDLSSTTNGVNWNINITIGGQDFTFGLDTGSSPLWVMSTLLSGRQNLFSPGTGKRFDPSKSKTFENTSGTFHVAYDKGENYLYGDVGIDNVTIGGLTARMPVGLATNVSEHVVGNDVDGIFGMAFGASNQLGRGQLTFMEAVISQLDEPVFTFNLPYGRNAQSLEFGKVDKSLYTGDLQTVAITNGTLANGLGWHARVGYSINGKNVSSQVQSTIFDTGGITPLANEDVVRAYWSLVKGAKDTSANKDASNWQFPCDSALPDLTYNFVGQDGKFVNATVPGRFFNYTALQSGSRTNAGGYCAGGLQNGKGSATVGYAFWHAFFTVFNQSAPSVSFAPYPQKELDAIPHLTGAAITAQPTAVTIMSTGAGSSNSDVSSYVSPTAGTQATATPASSSNSKAAAAAGITQSGPGWAAMFMSLLMMFGL